ncbi:hypothetical protein [Leadbetterella byssophila]|uniref:hypothetical protein n=1 Tax=Leadbetterella byssophila TaxID=316068 RepID=UPI0039A36F41
MKNIRLILCAGLGIFFLSCNKAKENYETTQELPPLDPRAGIYMYQDKDDTIRLEIQQFGSPVIGDLIISLKEKDKSIGTFNGPLQDSLLIGEYTYTSEGTSSIREVAFKFRGNSVFMGAAPMHERGGKMVFVDRSQIQFDENMPLVRL